ncbi:MAG: hypothetical protein U0271_10700 [Polyangiaceae bacterium]
MRSTYRLLTKVFVTSALASACGGPAPLTSTPAESRVALGAGASPARVELARLAAEPCSRATAAPPIERVGDADRGSSMAVARLSGRRFAFALEADAASSARSTSSEARADRIRTARRAPEMRLVPSLTPRPAREILIGPTGASSPRSRSPRSSRS